MHNFTFSQFAICQTIVIKCLSLFATLFVSQCLNHLPTVFTSSANFYILLVRPSSKSLENIMKSTGPKTKPCSTPLIMSVHESSYQFYTTRCFIFLNQDPIHLTKLPITSNFCSFVNNLFCGTLLMAF